MAPAHASRRGHVGVLSAIGAGDRSSASQSRRAVPRRVRRGAAGARLLQAGRSVVHHVRRASRSVGGGGGRPPQRVGRGRRAGIPGASVPLPVPRAPRRAPRRRPSADRGLRALPARPRGRAGPGAARRATGAGQRVLRVDAVAARQRGDDPARVRGGSQRAPGAARRRPRALRGGRGAGGRARGARWPWHRHGPLRGEGHPRVPAVPRRRRALPPGAGRGRPPRGELAARRAAAVHRRGRRAADHRCVRCDPARGGPRSRHPAAAGPTRAAGRRYRPAGGARHRLGGRPRAGRGQGAARGAAAAPARGRGCAPHLSARPARPRGGGPGLPAPPRPVAAVGDELGRVGHRQAGHGARGGDRADAGRSSAAALGRDGDAAGRHLAPTIGVVLRHRSVETTALYAKVDTALLRSVAQPWLGGAPC